MADSPGKPHIALLDLGVADLLTLGNGVMGLLAIASLFINVPSLAPLKPVHNDLLLATLLIGIGMVFDGLDGYVASKLGGSELGADLDSLSDMVTFVLAPAAMTLFAFGPIHPIASIIVAATVLIFGQVRLARFNSSPENEARDFTGLPSPVAAVAIALLIVTSPSLGLDAGAALAGIALLAFFMVSTVPYPKARRRGRSLLAGLLVFGLGVVAAVALRPGDAEPILVGALAVTLVIIAFGPITWIRLRRRGRGPDPLAPPDAPPGDEP